MRFNRRKTQLVIENGSCCKKCGHKGHPSIFDFHHRDPNKKEFNIRDLRGASFERLRAEIEKCDLLCACCHRLEHITPEYWEFDLENPYPVKEKQTKSCHCGTTIPARVKYCSATCSQRGQEIISWPENLAELVEKSSKRAVAASLGVSDKAVAKRLRNHQ
jgi:hypothetical protein